MEIYSAVVTLMQDLEELLKSYGDIFGLAQEFYPFTKEEIQILYHNLSLMDSLLRDSSGESYNRQLTTLDNTLGKLILIVAERVRNSIDFWVVEGLRKFPSTRLMLVGYLAKLTGDDANACSLLEGFYTLSEIGQHIVTIKEKRQKIHSGTSNTESKVVGPDKDSEAMSGSYTMNDIKALLIEDLRNNPDPREFPRHHLAAAEVHFSNLLRIPGNQDPLRIPDTPNLLGLDKDLVSMLGGLTLNEITEEIVSIKEDLQKILDDRKAPYLEVTSSPGKSLTFLTPSRRTPNIESKVVGLDKDLETMLDSLTGYPSQLKVFSITGMAGIGKTTFARTLYESPHVMHHFDVRAWVSVSQQYQVREVLLGILCCVTNVSDEIYVKSNEELSERLYKSLKGRRYAIVLDDMWDTEAWDDLKRIFPDDRNGSRIMLTSRLRDVAVHASQDTPPHCLRSLSMDESWELLSATIFVDESCPVELVAIGKQIAYKCQGLPLAIVVVGGLLSKMHKKVDVWEEVALSMGSLVMEEAEHCQNILALSYSHLPDQLKACFLYMGIFPEDYEISVKKLIWLWVAEGFIKPSMLKSLEEVAEDYLEGLTARNLILVKRKSSDGRIKTCYIHDLMRELCLVESRKQNFLHVIDSRGLLPRKNPHDDLEHSIYLHSIRRLSFHSSIREYIKKASFLYTRSVTCFEKLSSSERQSYLRMNFILLKVLDVMTIHLRFIPREIEFCTQLKFLAFTIQGSLTRSLTYLIWEFLFGFSNLQTVIVDCEWDGYLPIKFWDMLELRHFYLKRSCLSHLPNYSLGSPSTSVLELPGAELPLRILNNLQSLSTIRPISCTSKVFLSMPNLKKLGIYETEEDYQFRGWFYNLVHLRRLEKLKYVFSNPFVSSNLKPDRLPSWDSFPPNLVKLTLSGTSLPWEDMFKLSMLPKLEVLKLRNYAFSGAVWKCTEGGFRCLKFLLIGSTNLEIWEAEGTDFPRLQHLVLRHCRSLKEIPYVIGKAPLLGKIELHWCKESAVMSAEQLQEEQQDLGNDELIIQITKR